MRGQCKKAHLHIFTVEVNQRVKLNPAHVSVPLTLNLLASFELQKVHSCKHCKFLKHTMLHCCRPLLQHKLMHACIVQMGMGGCPVSDSQVSRLLDQSEQEDVGAVARKVPCWAILKEGGLTQYKGWIQ